MATAGQPRPDPAKHASVLGAVKDTARAHARAGLRPSLTAPARAGPWDAGRDEGMVPIRSNQGM